MISGTGYYPEYVTLSIHPKYQRQGHGRALVQWGMEKARGEGIFASLTWAETKEEFYHELGIVEVWRANVGPLEEVGGAVIFCDKLWGKDN